MQLIIVNNGLKDLRGHYFETSVAIAEAARTLGLRPVIGAHFTCPADLAPPGLELHPVFTTDHWMAGGLPPPLDCGGLRGCAATLRAVPVEQLRDGTATFLDYLDARFEPVLPVGAAAPPPPPVPRSTAKRLARALLPPLLHTPLRRLWQARHALPALARRAGTQVLPPVLYAAMRNVYRRARGVNAAPPAPPPPPPAPPPTDPFLVRLQAVGLQHELEYARRFRVDLERFLTLLGCGPGDHVFLPTAHARELLAVLWLLSDLGEGAAPTFHLEFRHDVLLKIQWNGQEHPHPYSTFHTLAFDRVRAYPPSDRVLLYTDTEELAEEYHDFSGLEYGVLPIPFRTRLIDRRERGDGPLHIAFLGDVRQEKGFAWLPDLVQSLEKDYLRCGHVRFLFQASLIHPEAEPLCREALEALKRYPAGQVELVGVGRSLTPEEYYDIVSRADLLLCPYDPKVYRSRSSGTLAEGISAGIPTVVPADGWLARQQPPGSGETFHDLPSFLEAVRRILDDYPRFRANSEEQAGAFAAPHSPERLVRALLGPGPGSAGAARPAA